MAEMPARAGTDGGSPWQVGPIRPDVPVDDPGEGLVERAAGPLVVEPYAPAPAVEDMCAVVAARPPHPDALVWVSAHGGAGSSTLAREAGEGLALTRQWPDPARGWPSRVVLVCRSNAAGLAAAAGMVQEVVSGARPGLVVDTLVVVADAPTKPPRPVRRRLREVSALVGHVVRVPWVAAWREDPESPDEAVAEAATNAAAYTKEARQWWD